VRTRSNRVLPHTGSGRGDAPPQGYIRIIAVNSTEAHRHFCFHNNIADVLA